MDLLGLCLDALLLLAVATGLLWGGAETSIRAYDREFLSGEPQNQLNRMQKWHKHWSSTSYSI